MNSSFDEGDFKKNRGMLLSFSSTLIALWFFGADLKTFSVLGTTVTFTQNTHHVWLVALVTTCYFILRFYQHSPGPIYANNEIYKKHFQNHIIKTMNSLKASTIKTDLNQKILSLGGVTDERFSHETIRATLNTVTNPKEKRRLLSGFSHVVIFHARGKHIQEPNTLKTTPAFQFDYPCPYWLVFLSTYRAKLIANIQTSLGTEYTLPYIWSGFAVVICILKWSTTNIT